VEETKGPLNVILKTENLINAIQNEPSIWNTKVNASKVGILFS